VLGAIELADDVGAPVDGRDHGPGACVCLVVDVAGERERLLSRETDQDLRGQPALGEAPQVQRAVGLRHERGHAGDHVLFRFVDGHLANRYLHGPLVDQIFADEQLTSRVLSASVRELT
jgi:hypothetical protein